MLGKSVGPAAGLIASVFALVVVVAAGGSCAHNVGQDDKSGEDSKQKGARPIKMDNGEGKAKGIVTYPGGDRVDWKVVELPEKKRGDLSVKLTWKPPRPGLQLAFDVYDEWNSPVASSAKKSSSKKSKGRTREATIANATGKYFIRVYAVNRGDAGDYRLVVDFKESNGPLAFDITKLDIPDPPKLAAIPEAEVACDPFAFDPKIPACKSVCPETGAPPGWPACKGKCPTPPDINVEACLATMPCPNPPDRRVKACPKTKWPKCIDIANPDPNNPNCDDAKADPVNGRVIRTEVQGNEVLITISVGSDSKISQSWKGHVLRGDTENYLDGGDFKLIRVAKRESVGKVKLTVDQVSQNQRVKLTPP